MAMNKNTVLAWATTIMIIVGLGLIALGAFRYDDVDVSPVDVELLSEDEREIKVEIVDESKEVSPKKVVLKTLLKQRFLLSLRKISCSILNMDLQTKILVYRD